jgi:alpha-mannosidase
MKVQHFDCLALKKVGMKKLAKRFLLILAATQVLNVYAQTNSAVDLTKQQTLYVVPYPNLDAQWRLEFPQTISEDLLKTLKVNFHYIDKYPHYFFNWTGSIAIG